MLNIIFDRKKSHSPNQKPAWCGHVPSRTPAWYIQDIAGRVVKWYPLYWMYSDTYSSHFCLVVCLTICLISWDAMKFPAEWNILHMFQSTNQIWSNILIFDLEFRLTYNLKPESAILIYIPTFYYLAMYWSFCLTFGLAFHLRFYLTDILTSEMSWGILAIRSGILPNIYPLVNV